MNVGLVTIVIGPNIPLFSSSIRVFVLMLMGVAMVTIP
jgi:hypothetical protein